MRTSIRASEERSNSSYNNLFTPPMTSRPHIRNVNPHSSLCCLSQAGRTRNTSAYWMSAWKTALVIMCAVGFYNLYRVSVLLDEIKDSLDTLAKRQEKLEAQIQSISRSMPQADEESNSSIGYLKVKEIVKKEIRLYDADKTARSDFALESAGGKILSIRSTRPYLLSTGSPIIWAWNTFASSLCSAADTARPIIQPGMLPGQCWAFTGAQGVAVVRLLGSVHVSGVTLEHIQSSVSPTQEISSAPKLFSLWGLRNLEESEGFFFGEFIFEKDGPSIQFFSVEYRSNSPFHIVQLKVHSNWGNPEYTCVYRLRVHGKLDKKYSQKTHYFDESL